MKSSNIFLSCLFGLTLVTGLMAAPKIQYLEYKVEDQFTEYEITDMDYTLEDVCDLITNKVTFPSHLEVQNISVGIGDPSSLNWINFTASSLTITGLEDLIFYDCSVEKVHRTIEINGAVDKIMIEFENYDMKGLLVDNIEVDGSGHGSVMIEKFHMLWDGQLDFKNITYFKEIIVDFSMYQWTVIFEHLMPGTDLGLLFNEFTSELGPEVANTIEDIFNQTGALTNIINTIIHKVINGKGKNN